MKKNNLKLVKKVIIILILIFSILGVSANTGDIDKIKVKINSSNDLNAKIFKFQNKKLQEKIRKLDKKIFELNDNSNSLKQNINKLAGEINSLEEKNLVLSEEKRRLKLEMKNKITEKKELKNILKDLSNNIFGDFLKNMKNESDEDRMFFYILIYLVSSVFILIFFYIFTLPLRMLRGIWRFFSGYKPCGDDKSNIEFKKLTDKYRTSVNKVNKLASENSKLVYENGKLKNKNESLKNKLKTNNVNKEEKEIENIFSDFNFGNTDSTDFQELHLHNTDDNINIKKEEEIFIFEDQKKKSNFNLTNSNKIKERKSVLVDKKSEGNIFTKKREKFSLTSDKNKKSKLFE